MILSIFLIFISSLFLILSFPNPGISWLIWVSFVPFLFAIDKKSIKQSFWLSCIFGFIFWSGAIYWISFVTSIGCVILLLYLSIYFAIFGLFVKKVNKFFDFHHFKSFLVFPVVISCFWVILEFIRSHLFTGFGWGLLGYSQYKILPLIQISDITGAYGISFLIIFVNLSVFYIIRMIRKKKFFYSLFFTFYLILILVAVLFYGNSRLDYFTLEDYSVTKVSVIQGNFPADEKWEYDLREKILEKYIDLTYMASFDNPDLIVWPETSVPSYINKRHWMKTRIAQCVKDIKIPVLMGAAWKDRGTNKYYNSAVYFSEDGSINEKYDKIHLVPFGEYFPFARYFPFVYDLFESGSFSPGHKFTVFNLNNFKFNALICYEDIFPGLVRNFINKESNFIINISEDSWYKRSGEVYQHLQALVFRAIENRVSAVRVANTGISGYISPIGEVYGKVKSDTGEEIFISGYNTESISVVNINTFYQKYGDIFVYLCGLFLLAFFIAYRNKIY